MLILLDLRFDACVDSAPVEHELDCEHSIPLKCGPFNSHEVDVEHCVPRVDEVSVILVRSDSFEQTNGNLDSEDKHDAHLKDAFLESHETELG
jgi:hypothetical protein